MKTDLYWLDKIVVVMRSKQFNSFESLFFQFTLSLTCSSLSQQQSDKFELKKKVNTWIHELSETRDIGNICQDVVFLLTESKRKTFLYRCHFFRQCSTTPMEGVKYESYICEGNETLCFRGKIRICGKRKRNRL